MPPFIPRKRRGSSDPEDLSASNKTNSARKRRKHTDEPTLNRRDNDSESALSSIDSDEFENVVLANNDRHLAVESTAENQQDDDMDWEDAIGENVTSSKFRPALESGNLEINLFRVEDEIQDYDGAQALAGRRKGPTKIERQIRLQTHCLHVQFLLYHNAIRNCWACDKEVQDILVKQLPPGIVKEVEKWKVASGLQGNPSEARKESTSRAKRATKSAKKMAAKIERNQRDWGTQSARLEQGKPDLSHGDPIIPLLKVVAAYWKKRFSVTAPGLRKRGYTTAAQRQRLIRSFKNEEHNVEKHGERIERIADFRKLAIRCKGSRDVGAQLFVALLRGIGIETRLVASLQPSGFGWNKSEQATVQAPRETSTLENAPSSSSGSDSEDEVLSKHWESNNHPRAKRKSGHVLSQPRRMENSSHARRESASDHDSRSTSDDASVIDVTPATPKRRAIGYDRDLPFPTYWAEAISSINMKVTPLAPLVLPNAVASTPEIVSTFEPRGAKADKAKQVMAYVVAYSQDGSAKDVTTRYLKKQMWPGKTKGVRLPIEKYPIYDAHGKVKRYEERDWFKSLMSGYVRTDKMRTAIDDLEESTDLVPRQVEKKEKGHEVDTLQSLRSSADFVLERFLKREEALRPEAKPVRNFITGKGDKLKEENVFRRADVDRCLSAESWHKEGRQVKEREAPMKLVPIRAVTLTRKREVEDMQRQTGEKPTQGLYSWDQTEWIIPPPIRDGVIPKNSYGNIDCFVPSMVPRGAVHVPLRGTVRICKKLEIDYAEAVTGFEFGNKLAVPVVEGVVIAKEHETAVRRAWEEFAERQRVKEEGKLEQAVLNLWKRMLMGLRIRERVSDTYGEDVDPHGGEVDGTLETANGISQLHSDADDRPGSALDDIPDGGGFLLDGEDEDGQETNVSAELEVVHHNEPKRQGKKFPKEQAPTASPNRPTPERKAKSKRKVIVISDTESSELSDPE